MSDGYLKREEREPPFPGGPNPGSDLPDHGFGIGDVGRKRNHWGLIGGGEMVQRQSGFSVTNRSSGAWRNLARFWWTNGKVVRFCPGYERRNVSFTAGNVEVNLGVAVFLLHPHMSGTGVG